MRISDCAEHTGVTVRTIRYYHQIGMLEVPERCAGRRDYRLEHVARILRIRWLVDAGLSLDTVRELLDRESAEATATPGPTAGPTTEATATTGREARTLHDLRETVRGLERQEAQVRTRRERAQALLAMAESGRSLHALPPGVHLFYEEMLRTVTDPGARELLRHEQRLAEMFAQRGLVPPAVSAAMGLIDDADRALVAQFYTRLAALPGLPESEAEVETAALVALVAGWMDRRADLVTDMLRALPAWARRPAAVENLMRLTDFTCPDPRQRDVLRGLTRLLVPRMKELP